ncbi:SPOSA6832_05105 [Sporobolomyces salmonicolor]|uniref:SPOSA6832_05105-mRNA-1:cds n=1 Tax=Sporidiobolus salmonicolor TaxID=5005 RepID=A0A0D6ESX2_SPOSA|nr:SPOSA6832_05105 [Sporobolomyces salmonicolor]
MSDAPANPSALSSGVASRFVSATALEEAAKKRSEEWKAAYERIGQEPPKEEDAAPYDGRSLWEKLQETKNKKQEAFEEQLKFSTLAILSCLVDPPPCSFLAAEPHLLVAAPLLPLPCSGADPPLFPNRTENHFRALDEDEISFLDSMVEENNDEERERQRQIRDELLSFRKAVTARSTAPVPPALASTLSPSSAPIASSSTPPLASTSGSAAPKPTAAASAASGSHPGVPVSTVKKGRKKSLPGLVLKKKKPSDTKTEGKKPATTTTSAAAVEAKKVEQQAVVPAVAPAGTKRIAESEAADEEDERDGSNSKKRRVVEEEEGSGGEATNEP